jgi:FMN-dependent NADH-azoreductase
MKKVLVINASARVLRSQSRKLTEVFIDQWKSIHTDSALSGFVNWEIPMCPTLMKTGLQQLSNLQQQDLKKIEALKISDTYIAELQEADVIVLGSPMYNWSIPSTLKAYILTRY